MPEPAKPVIALSGKMTVNEEGKKASSKSVLNMKKLLEEAGAQVVIIDPLQADPRKLQGYSAVVFMGNDNDLDPKRYGVKEANEKTKVETDRKNYKTDADHLLGIARADYEYTAMEEARKKSIPVLGVCGGMQRWNVICGGTLNQHVENHMQSENPAIPVQHITLEKDTRLARIAGDKKGLYAPAPGGNPTGKQYTEDYVNNFHHQVLEKIGTGLKITAKYEDGYVAAVEGKNFIGVQWHPEFMPDNPLSKKLVKDVVESAREYEKQRKQEQPASKKPRQEQSVAMLPLAIARNSASRAI